MVLEVGAVCESTDVELLENYKLKRGNHIISASHRHRASSLASAAMIVCCKGRRYPESEEVGCGLRISMWVSMWVSRDC